MTDKLKLHHTPAFSKGESKNIHYSNFQRSRVLANSLKSQILMAVSKP
ncbi:MAG: hypothetical protein IPJ02_17950 [Chitinophagaceae bacterium]|nr:hypothetical protein [Chitinophagaceae bacterium]